MILLRIFVSLLLIIGFVGLFGLKSFSRFLEDGVTISKFEFVPEKISSPGKWTQDWKVYRCNMICMYTVSVYKYTSIHIWKYFLVIYGLIYTDARSSYVDTCLQQESVMEFDKCLKGENSSSFKFKEINLKPYRTSKFITSYGTYETILPGDEALGVTPFSESLSFDSTEDNKFYLYDKNFFFPTLNFLSVPRTSFRINKHTAHYQISFQVSFRKYLLGLRKSR